MKSFRRISASLMCSMLLVGGLQSGSVQAKPVHSGVQVPTKAVKKCTLKKGAACKGKGVSKQKVGKKNLSGVKLSKGKITGSKFTGTTLTKADFSGSMISDTTFSGANLRDANFKGATLRNVTFDAGTDVSNLDLSSAKISNVTFKNTIAPKAGKSFRGVINTPELWCGEVYRLDCHGVSFRNAQIELLSAYDADLRFADFGNAKILKAQITLSALGYANFSYASMAKGWFAYNNFNHAFFYKTTCPGWSEENISDGAFFGDSKYCETVAAQKSRSALVYGANGRTVTTFTVEGNAKFALYSEQTFGQNSLKGLCVDVTSCTVSLYSQGKTQVKIFSNRSIATSEPGWDCETPIPTNENGYSKLTTCSFENPSEMLGSNSIQFNSTVRVRFSIQSSELMPNAKVASIKLYQVMQGSSDELLKTCSNASICDYQLAEGVTVYWKVSNPIASGWIMLLPDYQTGVVSGSNNVLRTDNKTITDAFNWTALISPE